MTFEEMYTSYYGEKLDRIEQLSAIQFTGEELKSFVEHCIQQKLNIASVSGSGHYQLCPMCAGEGQVLNNGTTSSLFRTCPLCNGSRTLYHPPVQAACASGAVDTVAEAKDFRHCYIRKNIGCTCTNECGYDAVNERKSSEGQP